LGFAEKRGIYWRGRYKVAPGKHNTVVDENGKAIRFATKGEAQRAAAEAENKYRRGEGRPPALGQETFGEYANRWYEAQDLAASTMQNYKRHIEEHLLPEFEDKALAGILRTDVDLWEKKEKALYAASSVKTALDAPPDLRGRDRRGPDHVQPGRPAARTRQACRPLTRPRPGEGGHRRARHPADRRARRPALRP
jgi:hypothetical protein